MAGRNFNMSTCPAGGFTSLAITSIRYSPRRVMVVAASAEGVVAFGLERLIVLPQGAPQWNSERYNLLIYSELFPVKGKA